MSDFNSFTTPEECIQQFVQETGRIISSNQIEILQRIQEVMPSSKNAIASVIPPFEGGFESNIEIIKNEQIENNDRNDLYLKQGSFPPDPMPDDVEGLWVTGMIQTLKNVKSNLSDYISQMILQSGAIQNKIIQIAEDVIEQYG